MTETVYTKVCTKCGIEKSLDEFTRDKYAKDGRTPSCKGYRNQYSKQYASNNPEKVKTRQKKYRNTHREEILEKEKLAARLYRLNNKEQIVKRRALHRQENREELLIKGRAYVRNNKEKIRLSAKKSYEKNKEKYRENAHRCGREWSRENRLKKNEYLARRRARLKNNGIEKVDYSLVLQRDNGVCYICNRQVMPEDLHFDHIIPVVRSGPHTFDNLAVVHALCNWRKGSKLLEEMY